MEVTITVLRTDLARWIDRAESGEGVVVTRRGQPVARLVGIGTTSLMNRLVAEGVVTPPSRAKSLIARESTRVRASGPVADLVEEMRR